MIETPQLTADLMLRGYAAGVFPMAETAGDPELFWVNPTQRGVLPLDGFHLSRSLARRIRRADFEVTTDQAFNRVVTACAERAETWINAPLKSLYAQLFAREHAHSLEVWRDGQLIGGIFGVTLGGAFFGESMFSRQTDASKIALAFLVSRLRAGGFALFDVQFQTDHLASLGVIEVERSRYHALLRAALQVTGDFNRQPSSEAASGVLQLRTQTS